MALTKIMYDLREVMDCFTLEPGEYIVIPYTHDPNQSASFILSILSKMETHTEYVLSYNAAQWTWKLAK